MPTHPLTITSSARHGGTAAAGTLEATWSNWWGSHHLFAAVASAAETAIRHRYENAPVSTTFFVATRRAPLEYSSVEAFASAGAPELFKGFNQVRSVTSATGVSVVFELNRPKRFDLTGQGVARLVVTGESDPASLLTVAKPSADMAGSRYRFFWGSCNVPESLGGQRWYERRGNGIRIAINSLLGAIVGVCGYVIAAQFPGLRGAALLVVAVGFLLPWILEAAIPRVEIAFRAKTRLVLVLVALSSAIAGSVGPKLLSALFS